MLDHNEMDNTREVSVLDKLLGMGKHDIENDSPELDQSAHSIKLLYDSFIKGQINSPLTITNIKIRQKDFLSAIANKVQMLESRTDADSVEEIKSAYRSILINLINLLEIKFVFDTSELNGILPDDADMDTLISMAHSLYNFLVLDRVDNIVAYLKTRIYQDRKTLAKTYKVQMEDRRNMSMASLKGSLASFDDVVVMFYLDDIVHSIASEHVSFADLISTLEIDFQDEVSLVGTKGIIDPDNNEFVVRYMAPVLISPEMTREFTQMVTMGLLPLFPQKKLTPIPAAIKSSK